MSRIAKIAAASFALLAVIAIGSPASATPRFQPMGGTGCCAVVN